MEEAQERRNIVSCMEVSRKHTYRGPRPKTLRWAGAKRILDRRIIRWSYRGSYGMGGPGFFGLELTAKGRYPREWLVLTLWGAGEWLLLDGEWVEAHPNQYHIRRPLYSNFGETLDWDHLTGKLAGWRITRAAITHHSSKLVLLHGVEQHILELPQDTTRLPVWGGSLEPKRWNPAESHLDAWVLSRRGELVTS